MTVKSNAQNYPARSIINYTLHGMVLCIAYGKPDIVTANTVKQSRCECLLCKASPGRGWKIIKRNSPQGLYFHNRGLNGRAACGGGRHSRLLPERQDT
jgi:hypothetical protein